MDHRHSIAEARSNLPQLIREAEHGKGVELTRHGKPVAVLLGRRQYERLVDRSRSFDDAYRSFTASVDLARLDLRPDAVFGDARSPDRGRDVPL